MVNSDFSGEFFLLNHVFYPEDYHHHESLVGFIGDLPSGGKATRRPVPVKESTQGFEAWRSGPSFSDSHA